MSPESITLRQLAYYVKDQVGAEGSDIHTYISTETMIPDKGGIVASDSVPTSGNVNSYCPGDVLISNIRPYFKKIWKANRHGCCSTDVLVIRAKNPILSDFLFAILSDNRFFNHIMLGSKGTKMPRGDKEQIMDYQIIKIDVESMVKIGKIDSIIIDYVKTIKAINDNLFDIVFSDYKHTFESCCYKNVSLMDVCTFVSRGVTPNYEKETNNWVLGQTCIRNHVVSMDNARTVSSKDYKEKTVHKGDILVNSTGVGSLGRVAQLWFEHSELIADSHITIVRPVVDYSEYLGCFLMSSEEVIENMAEGSTGQTELPRKTLMTMSVPLPESSVVKSFNRRVKPIFEMIYHNLDLNQKLTSLRDCLIPKLISGKVDVSSLPDPTKYSFITGCDDSDRDH